MSSPIEPKIHERRIGFPLVYLLIFVVLSGVVPLLILNFGTRTVPGAQMSWILVSLLTGGMFVYELLHWRKTIRFEIGAEGVAFTTLSDPVPKRIAFEEI
jgi:hypothetical protein